MNIHKRTTPESLGFKSEDLIAFYNELTRNKMPMHNFILMRHNRIVTQGSWAPFTKDMNHIMYSTSKTITALAIGMCIEEGRCALDDKIVDYFPEKITGPLHPYNKERTIYHLLTMTGGGTGTIASIDRSHPDWLKSYLNTPPPIKPGTLFGYDNAATHTLGALVQKVSGMTLMEYLIPRLFEPLGISGAYWHEQMGINTASRGFHCSIVDIAKIAQLILQEGQWEGQQLISKSWLQLASQKHIEVTNFGNIDGTPGYGFQFWMYRDGAYGSNGVGGQHFIVYPKYDVIWAFTGNMFDYYGNGSAQFMHLAWPLLFNNISETPLPENKEAYEQLLHIEKQLHYPTSETMVKASVHQETLLNGTWVLAKNSEQFHELTLHQIHNGLHLQWTYGKDNTLWEFDAPMNKWHAQPITITDDNGWARYGWRNDRLMECTVLLHQQLGSYRIMIHVVDKDTIAIEIFSLGWIRDYKQLHIYTMAKRQTI